MGRVIALKNEESRIERFNDVMANIKLLISTL